MTESDTERGPRAVIESEIDEATELATKHRSLAGVIRFNFWTALVGTVVFALDVFISPPADWGLVAFLVAWTCFNGWSLRKLRSRIDELDDVVAERRAALISGGDT